jgi:outer membrane protein
MFMKTMKSFSFILALLILPVQIFAWDNCGEVCPPQNDCCTNVCEDVCQDPCQDSCCGSDWLNDTAINFRVAAFLPSSKKVRNIYADAIADYQLEFSKTFCGDWQAFFGVSYASVKGRSLGLCDRTRLRVVPLTLGAKYLFCVADNTQLYLGAGVTYSFLKIRDHSDYVHQHISKGHVGGVIQSGLYYTFCNDWFVNVFLDYYFQHFNFSNKHHCDSSYSDDLAFDSGCGCSSRHHHSYRNVERHDLNLSGVKTGVGIGYKF